MITFKTEEAHSAFHSMAEGMWENARDDYVTPTNKEEAPQCKLYERLIGETGYTEGMVYPKTYHLSTDVVAVAQAVLDNMDDNERLDLDEPETYAAGRHNIVLDPDVIDPALFSAGNRRVYGEKDVVGFGLRGEMGSAEALEEAIAIVEERCSETDTASPEGFRARACLDTLTDMLQQQGCEHLAPMTSQRVAKTGRLTDVIDVLVFG